MSSKQIVPQRNVALLKLCILVSGLPMGALSPGAGEKNGPWGRRLPGWSSAGSQPCWPRAGLAQQPAGPGPGLSCTRVIFATFELVTRD